MQNYFLKLFICIYKIMTWKSWVLQCIYYYISLIVGCDGGKNESKLAPSINFAQILTDD